MEVKPFKLSVSYDIYNRLFAGAVTWRKRVPVVVCLGVVFHMQILYVAEAGAGIRIESELFTSFFSLSSFILAP